MNKKKLIVTVSSVLAVLAIAGLIWWSENAWFTLHSQTAGSSDSSSTSSSERSSSEDIGGSVSQGQRSEDTGVLTEGPGSDPSSSAESSKTSPAGSDSNDPDDGVARDPASVSESTNAAGAKATADVRLSWVDVADGSLTANGWVSNIVQNNGQCTLSASKDGVVRQSSGNGLSSGTTTSCGTLTIPRDQLGTGTWTVTLSYASDQAAGASKAQSVKIS
ncbi:hypothetical protein [Bifidobacterium crudilactis]|jgi:hypothetical protein|uniref:hypothetical protein n=1 Tax=Bifidobacterium crudilactis TaxID=327277 RepID=UPI0005513090|nr:hypothetical protein [Bifidobacterium crudilactis]MCI2148730.1 hypothetical protein [Bifidobacterium crudilactis]MCI2156962.1 hypothetical protein [Bifidobacterium crudilactis]